MRIILLGFGTVGQSFARLLIEEHDWLVKTYGFEPTITTVIDSRGTCSDEDGLDLRRALRVKAQYGTVRKYSTVDRTRGSVAQTIEETEAETMIETTPSNFNDGEPGLSNIRRALINGKHVVTTNKGPLALAMPALLELADHKGLQLRFSGTVGGGTPFLSFAMRSLPGDRVLGVHGILNGTSNYVLTKMETSAMDFQEALADAQKKGYAERDPTNDIEGFDTAAKIVIISNWVLKRRINIHDLNITGIAKITPQIIKRAHASGTRVKLIGRLSETQATVKPENVDQNDPVCVPNTLNALAFSMKHAGDVTLIGRGAGGEETASAIIRDLVDIRQEYST